MYGNRRAAPLLGLATLAVLSLSLLGLCARPAAAQTTGTPDFTFTVSDPNILVGPGATSAVYNGTLTFTATPAGRSVPANFTVPTPPPTVLVSASPAFVTFFIGAIGPGSSYTGPIYAVSITPGAPAGAGTLILPGSFIKVADNAGSITVPVSLAVVPEPRQTASLGLGALGLLALLVRARRRRTAA